MLQRQKDEIVESWKRGKKPNLKRSMIDVNQASTSYHKDTYIMPADGNYPKDVRLIVRTYNKKMLIL